MKNSLLNKFTSKKKTAVAIAFILVSLVYSLTTFASPGGKTGKTTTGCTCHSSQSSNTTLTAFLQSGGAWSVAPNSTNTIIVTLHNSVLSHGGVDISVKTTSGGETNIGTLSPVSTYLKSSNGELTQTASTSYTDSLQFQFTWTAPSTPGTYYLKAAGLAAGPPSDETGDQWNIMTPQAIVVETPASTVTLTSPNGAESWCAGSSQNITWTYQGVTNVKIELSSDGGSSFPTTLTASTPASAGTWAWSVPTSLVAGTNYIVRISDASNSSTSDVSNAAFSIKPITAITQQPQTISACLGTSANFSVTATGANLTYQWRKDGQNISNETASAYNISSVTAQSAGNYDCIVTGACGNAITSSQAALTVDLPPAISSQPNPVQTCAGQPASFSITASGTNLTYQWQKDGQNLAGKTSAQLNLTNVQTTDAGDYKVIISGKCTPTVTSQTAALTVLSAPAITKQPTDQTVTKGGTINLSITATGTTPTYQWQKTGVDIPNATQSTLVITNAKIEDSGNYTCKVTNTCGTVNSNSALITVQDITAPILTLTSDLVDFGKVTLATSKDSTFTALLTNSGNADLSITNAAISGTDASSFQLMNFTLPLTIKPSQSASLTIKFQPASGGSKTAIVTFTSNGGNKILNLNGFGLILDLSTSVPELTFSFTTVGVPVTQNITILNKSNVDLNTEMVIGGKNPEDFAVTAEKTFVLTTNGNKISELTFTPSVTTDQEAELQVSAKEYGLIKTVKLIAHNTTGIADNSDNIQISIVPNPSTDGVIVELNNITGENVKISIYDENGLKITDLSNNSSVSMGNKLNWDLTDNQGRRISNGIYNVLIQFEGKVIRKPLIIIR